MRKQIIRIAPLQTAKVLAVLYFAITLPFIILSTLFMWAMPGERSSAFSGFILLTPVLYALFGFVFTLFGTWVYNLVAQRIGGIEFETEEISVARDEINAGASEI